MHIKDKIKKVYICDTNISWYKRPEPWFSSFPISTICKWLTSPVECRVFWFTSHSSEPYQSAVIYLPHSCRGANPTNLLWSTHPSHAGSKCNQNIEGFFLNIFNLMSKLFKFRCNITSKDNFLVSVISNKSFVISCYPRFVKVTLLGINFICVIVNKWISNQA